MLRSVGHDAAARTTVPNGATQASRVRHSPNAVPLIEHQSQRFAVSDAHSLQRSYASHAEPAAGVGFGVGAGGAGVGGGVGGAGVGADVGVGQTPFGPTSTALVHEPPSWHVVPQ